MSEEVYNYIGELDFKKWMENPFEQAIDILELLKEPGIENDNADGLYDWLKERKAWALKVVQDTAARN